MRQYLTLCLLCIFMVSCGNPPTEADVQELFWAVPIEMGSLVGAVEQLEYEKECYIEVPFFCFEGSELWRAIGRVDWCTGEVISLGPCEPFLECMPANGVLHQEPCEEFGMSGFRDVYCPKGFYQKGPCVPCTSEEVCDGHDNDCDGETDEGDWPCGSPCGSPPQEEICNGIDDDCDGETDEHQLNACGSCGPVPSESCNGLDDDCNGTIDDNLTSICTTSCETDVKICVGGMWVCTAEQPTVEICDGLDNDCDGAIDEELDCSCSLLTLGIYIPCMEPPLTCGQGLKQCQCTDETCNEFKVTACKTECSWFGIEPCNLTEGKVMDEVCNNWDDDCNSLIDESLVESCYTGPPETLYVGPCLPGETVCSEGKWGWVNGNGTHVEGVCFGQVVPEAEICDGFDNDCDGVADKGEPMEPTDILFILDWSGSMVDKIQDVLSALYQFSLTYTDEDVIHWGLVRFSVGDVVKNTTTIDSQPASLVGFVDTVSGLLGSVTSGSAETSIDSMYLCARDLLPDPNVLAPLSWCTDYPKNESKPPLESWEILWRPDTHRVIILISDEEPQSYLCPGLEVMTVAPLLAEAEDLFVYVFSLAYHLSDYEPFHQYASSGGQGFTLTGNPQKMFSDLMTILDQTACQ